METKKQMEGIITKITYTPTTYVTQITWQEMSRYENNHELVQIQNVAQTHYYYI